MIFVYKNWDSFCKKLSERGMQSIPASKVTSEMSQYLVLKHDVETDVVRAHRMASIECSYGHAGSYYVQAYLLQKKENLVLLQEMQAMGHEVSYHYDVMDSCRGNLEQAIVEFEQNKRLFEENGFKLKTLCQHGNPVMERKGYTSNRDFFRSERVQAIYPFLSDIMVDFPEKYQTEYVYFSDAGRQFKMIYDPLYNDIISSVDKNVSYPSLDAVLESLALEGRYIISTHPHRWMESAGKYLLKTGVFKAVKGIAKQLMKIPFMKNWMSRYYYLAKKL